MLTERERSHIAAKARNLLNEYGPFLQGLVDDVIKELDTPINETTVDAIALQYVRREGGKESLRLLMKKLNSKTNE